MKARAAIVTRFGGAEVVALEERPVEAPGPTQVRVRVEASSLSATDVWVRRGIYPLLRLRPPFVPGYDLVGRVEAVGDRVHTLEVGTRVVGLLQVGAHADVVVADEALLVPAPLDLEAAALAPLVCAGITAFQSLHRLANVQAGDRVLIHGGSGAVGSLAIQLVRHAGAEVVATASKGKLRRVTALGAEAVDYAAPNVDRELARRGPFDVVLDPIGPGSVWRSLRTLRPRRGRLVTYAIHARAQAIQRRSLAARVRFGASFASLMGLVRSARWLGARAAWFYGVVDHFNEHRDWYRADFEALADLVRRGVLEPSGDVVPFERLRDAHERLDRGATVGPVVLSMGR
jgi:NADPH:quinone reductase-like Zn-dependent oxidoreductase